MRNNSPRILALAIVLAACSDNDASRLPTAPLFERTDNSPQAGDYTTVDVPGGSTFETALDINNAGVIVGRFLRNGQTFGYQRDGDGIFTTIQFPGAVFTVAAGINDRGDITGQYSLPSDLSPGRPAVRHGYQLHDGVYTSFDPPTSVRTNSLGIDNREEIVGRFQPTTKITNSGFLFRDGAFTTIDYPGVTETDLWQITRRHVIVGAFGGTDGRNHVFVLRRGVFRIVDPPGAADIAVDKGDMNARGEIVGGYCDASPCSTTSLGIHGFLRPKGGGLVGIDVPSALGTFAFGLNDRRDVVGAYSDANGISHGFLVRLHGKEGDDRD